jgi:hypothetical protein
VSYGLSIDARDAVTPALARLGAAFRDTEKLNAKIGGDELLLVRQYLTQIAEERHTTAEELGASPSRHWGNPDSYTTMRAESDAAIIAINKPGIGRVGHDVTIVPGEGKQWLTTAIDRLGYNQRARGLAGLFFVQPKGKSFALLGRRTNNPYNRDDAQDAAESQVTWIYLLLKSVLQKQDRTLLPPDEAFLFVAGRAADEYADAALNAAGGNN